MVCKTKRSRCNLDPSLVSSLSGTVLKVKKRQKCRDVQFENRIWGK